MTTSSRAVAYRCLQRVDQDGAYANLVTPAELGRSELPERDRKFVTDLVYGTTRMRRACDALVDRFLATEPVPEIRTLLRLGLGDRRGCTGNFPAHTSDERETACGNSRKGE